MADWRKVAVLGGAVATLAVVGIQLYPKRKIDALDLKIERDAFGCIVTARLKNSGNRRVGSAYASFLIQSPEGEYLNGLGDIGPAPLTPREPGDVVEFARYVDCPQKGEVPSLHISAMKQYRDDELLPHPRRLEGVAGLSFGSDVEDVIRLIGVSNFHPALLGECLNDIPVKGCVLSSNDDATLISIEGIPLHGNFRFNTKGQLTEIGLSYRREGEITRDQCSEMVGRLIDGIVGEYGRLEKSTFNEGKGVVQRTTKKGTNYRVFEANNGGFLMTSMRTLGRLERADTSKPITEWDDQPYVAPSAFFLNGSGTPLCLLTATFVHNSEETT